MCSISDIPYFKEIAIGALLVLFAISVYKDGKCGCKKEIDELKEEIQSLKKDKSDV